MSSSFTFTSDKAEQEFRLAVLTMLRKVFSHAEVQLDQNETYAVCLLLDGLLAKIPEP